MTTQTPPQETISVAEFKAWLKGITEMLGDVWTPSPEQWAIIRAKVDMLRETYPTTASAPHIPIVRAGAEVGPAPVFDYSIPAVPAGPSALTNTPSLPNAPRMASTPSGVPVTFGSGHQPGVFGNEHAPSRTPEIDTSSGRYESSFR